MGQGELLWDGGGGRRFWSSCGRRDIGELVVVGRAGRFKALLLASLHPCTAGHPTPSRVAPVGAADNSLLL